MRRPQAASPRVDRSAFAGFRFPLEVITVAVRWYLATDCLTAMSRSCWPSVASRSITSRYTGALLRSAGSGKVGLSGVRWSDGSGELGEGGGEPMLRREIGGELVVAAAEVLHEGVSGGDHRARPEAFESAHRPEPGFEPAMVGRWEGWPGREVLIKPVTGRGLMWACVPAALLRRQTQAQRQALSPSGSMKKVMPS